jgi:hypothetical protein
LTRWVFTHSVNFTAADAAELAVAANAGDNRRRKCGDYRL